MRATDPFENAIAEALDGPLDDELFEACACDVLRDAYPTLAPIPGGSDAGMDGAIGEAHSEPIPLIATTSTDKGLANLKRSLDSYVAQGGLARRAVFATPRRVTPQKKRNLEAAAQARGFVLLNVYQQQAFVNRLYSNPRWCLKLLGLSGSPPALAVVPSGKRPLVDIPLVGQERTREWLANAVGDRLLVGPPGSGKTYLLYDLTRGGLGLFMETNDATAVAGALRHDRPGLVIVDDAHLHLDRLRTLRQLRRQGIAAQFSIVASTWEGEYANSVLDELGGIAATSALPRLSRNHLVEIVRAVGIHGPPRLIREIVNQAANRPGLAVTLAVACMSGHLGDVVSGTALSRTLLTQLRQQLDSSAIYVLATLAASGRTGMRLSEAAAFLDESTMQVTDLVARLAPAGIVVSQSGRRHHPPDPMRFAVQPRALRYALVRDCFFNENGPSLDFTALAPLLQDLGEASETLVGSAHRGATIPRETIEPLLQGHGTPDAWNGYAALGSSQADWVLAQWDDPVPIASGALAASPRNAVARLLDVAVGNDRSIDSAPRHPLRILRDWLHDLDVAQHRPTEWIARRDLATHTILAWSYTAASEPARAMEAMCLALSPRLQTVSSDPGKGDTITISQGVVSSEQLAALVGLWPRLFALLEGADSISWRPIEALLHQWIFPDTLLLGRSLEEERLVQFHEAASAMVLRLQRTLTGHDGIARRLGALGSALGIKREPPSDALLEVLAPHQSDWSDDWDAEWRVQQERVETAATQRWPLDPAVVVGELVRTMSSADEAAISLDSFLSEFVSRLAESTVHPPSTYLDILLSIVPPRPELVAPFIERMLRERHPLLSSYIQACLSSEQYRPIGFSAALRHKGATEALQSQALRFAPHYCRQVEILCLREQLAKGVVKMLLLHEDEAVALSAAQGYWRAAERTGAKVALTSAWRSAILRASETDHGRHDGHAHFLFDVFSRDSDLALAWLETTLQRCHWHCYYSDTDPMTAAFASLSTDQRIRLLAAIPPGCHGDEAVAGIVSTDLDAYAALLADPAKASLWAAPLRRGFDDSWIRMARSAVAAGVEAKEIAHEALTGGGWTIHGSESVFWKGRLAELSAATKDVAELSSVQQAGEDFLQMVIKRAEEEELAEDLSGLDGD